MIETETRSESKLRRIELVLRPERRFPVPESDGYSVYSALLGVIRDVDEDVSAHIHDSQLGSLHSSGLSGRFGGSDRRHHKTVLPNETYRLSLGVIDPGDADIFQALVNAVVLEQDALELTNGTLRVESFESENVTHAELLKRADELDDPHLEFQFETATCIEEADGVTTMFPHRGAVFSSLVGKWCRSAPDEYELELSREEIETNVIEKPDAGSYKTHSVLVNRVRNGNGESRNIFRQGFTGECTYAFKDASESVANAVTALALFGEYSGVGSAVARGCGTVQANIIDT
jgi:CRISPR-associated endoribonuclease Cas6